ncbi:MAG TPA: dihydrofolate reductase family protein [Solirubrobacteraceae bacterium]|nr:dihydrofolate reductase family protein [Solirubrobacteraceae bacterium]
MGQILVHEFISLDGVFEAPRWTMEYGFAPKMGEAIGGIMGGCKAILLGRQTFEEFAPAWSGRSADQDPGAPFMNDTPKYVVSATLETADWRNSTILGRYSADAIRGLKDEVDGGIYVSGSGTLVRAMLDDGLIDELNLFVYPVALGTGARLFGDNEVKFNLAQSHSYDNGVIHLAYRPAS